MNEICIDIFNTSLRNELFFCWAGIIATLVVFVAEAIKDNENALSKKIILKKSKIKEAVTCVVILMLLLWTVSIFKDYTQIGNNDRELYEIIQLIINLLLFLLFILTIKNFAEVIKILVDKEYFMNEIIEYVKTINNKYNSQSDILNNNCKEININIIQLNRSENNDYDIDLLKDYLKCLYSVKNYKSINHFNSQIENEYIKNKNNRVKTNLYILLSELSKISRNKEDVESFKKYYYLLTCEYIKRIEQEDLKKKELTLDFINDIYTYKFNNFKPKDLKYYDIALSCILYFMYQILLITDFSIVQVINENIRKLNENTLNSNFQFLYGVSRYLIVANKKEKIKDKESDDATKIINKFINDIYLKISPDSHFQNTHDISTFILKFKELYNKTSVIQQTYDNCESIIYKDEYHNMFSWVIIGEEELLSNLLKMISPNLYVFNNDIDMNLINENDIAYFDLLKKAYECLVKSNQNTKDITMINTIDELRTIAEHKKEEYIINSRINDKKTKSIINELEKNIIECNSLLKFIKNENKLKIISLSKIESSIKDYYIDSIENNVICSKEIFIKNNNIFINDNQLALDISEKIEDMYLNAMKKRFNKRKELLDLDSNDLTDNIVIIDRDTYLKSLNLISNGKIKINNKEYTYIVVNKSNTMLTLNRKLIQNIYLCYEKDTKSRISGKFFSLYEQNNRMQCELKYKINIYIKE